MDGQGVDGCRWMRVLHSPGIAGLVGDDAGVDWAACPGELAGDTADASSAAVHQGRLDQQLLRRDSSYAIYTQGCTDRGRIGREGLYGESKWVETGQLQEACKRNTYSHHVQGV